jgi:hypothetical protein
MPGVTARKCKLFSLPAISVLTLLLHRIPHTLAANIREGSSLMAISDTNETFPTMLKTLSGETEGSK